MPDLSSGPGPTLALESVASTLRAADGREVPFARAVLVVRNDTPVELRDVVLHATLGQEGGTLQDVSGALAGMEASLPPGGVLRWDVYDRLLPAHPGTASKVHMFGYRAALNWRFDLDAWVEYRVPGAAAPLRTPPARWSLRWSLAEAASGPVRLAIEERPGAAAPPSPG